MNLSVAIAQMLALGHGSINTPKNLYNSMQTRIKDRTPNKSNKRTYSFVEYSNCEGYAYFKCKQTNKIELKPYKMSSEII